MSIKKNIQDPLKCNLQSEQIYDNRHKRWQIYHTLYFWGSEDFRLLNLIDLSLPMLERARERISELNSGRIRIFQGDFRTLDLPEKRYDVILAAAVLHHLRDDQDWQLAFKKIYRLTATGGSVWITDLVSHETEPVQALMWKRYSEYLQSLGGEAYKDNVLDYLS
jgi:tRNA (cmo5U34)-methyltransferase